MTSSLGKPISIIWFTFSSRAAPVASSEAAVEYGSDGAAAVGADVRSVVAGEGAGAAGTASGAASEISFWIAEGATSASAAGAGFFCEKEEDHVFIADRSFTARIKISQMPMVSRENKREAYDMVIVCTSFELPLVPSRRKSRFLKHCSPPKWCHP
jgi:hypothetical protein